MRLDINLARGIVTVLWFSLFVAISVNAWSRRRRAEFDAAAHLPLEAAEGTTVSPRERT